MSETSEDLTPRERSLQGMRRLLTVRDVSDRLSVSPQTIHGWRYKREPSPPAIMIGGRLRFREDDLERWIEEQAETLEPASQSRATGRPVTGGGR